MRRYFNTEGQCEPEEHFMVRLEERLEKIKTLYVDRGKYFVINRGRQYGKTTTLRALAEYLKDCYIVISMDFQAISDIDFADEPSFVVSFIEYMNDIFVKEKAFMGELDTQAFESLLSLKEQDRISIGKMFRCLSRLCETAKKPIVLMIDEVDSATNNRVFVDFLSKLRECYLNGKKSPTLHTVILAGDYDNTN